MTALLVLTLMVYDCSRELTLIYMIGAVMTLTWTTWRTTLKTFETYEKEIKVTARGRSCALSYEAACPREARA